MTYLREIKSVSPLAFLNFLLLHNQVYCAQIRLVNAQMFMKHLIIMISLFSQIKPSSWL